MKRKISVSFEESTIAKLDGLLENGAFRNKSHIVEFAVKKLLEERQ